MGNRSFDVMDNNIEKNTKQFDFTKFKQRHVALKLLYFGWDYSGLATQLDREDTIEFHLFQALSKTCLIESRLKCGYNRCGRTDKGVSSSGQVVNLFVRSNLVDEYEPQNVGLFTPEGYTGSTNVDAKRKQELDYVGILNRVLPTHIKVIAWAPVKKNFSSRFNCKSRSYSYIFPLGDLNIHAMKIALSYLVGEHDFRNLCSFDIKHGVTNHKRVIISAQIEPNIAKAIMPTPDDPYSFHQVVIVGQAFLYHQIRCIMTILFLIGRNKEPPEVMRDLLNITTCPARPKYNRASPMPLCLFDCKYDASDFPLGWFHDYEALSNLIRQLKHLWLNYKTKSLMIERALTDLEIITSRDQVLRKDKSNKRLKIDRDPWKDFGLECDNISDTKYIPLLDRPREESLESKLESVKAKTKDLPVASNF